VGLAATQADAKKAKQAKENKLEKEVWVAMEKTKQAKENKLEKEENKLEKEVWVAMESTKVDTKKQSIAERMKMECSLPGDDCSTSQCCRDFGYQCFAKKTTWASCMETCTPATTIEVANGSWTCKALGEKNR